MIVKFRVNAIDLLKGTQEISNYITSKTHKYVQGSTGFFYCGRLKVFCESTRFADSYSWLCISTHGVFVTLKINGRGHFCYSYYHLNMG